MAEIARAFTMADVDAARQFIASRTIHYRMGDTGEAARAAAFNLNPIAAVRSANMIAAGEAATGEQAVVTEAWRSDATQAVYRANREGRPVTYRGVTYAPDTYVTEDGKTVTRKTAYPTARPGNSNHREGGAIDVSSHGGSGAVRSWMRKNASSFGIRTIRGDDPHFEVNESTPLSDEEANYVVQTLGYDSVEDFQEKNEGLSVDGVVGPQTTKAMIAAIAQPSVDAALDPANKPYTVYSSDVRKAEEEGKIAAVPPMTVAEAMQHRYADDPFGVAKSKGTAVAGRRPPIEITPADRDVAIRTILGEAAGEGADGQAAVAHVIANRYDQGYGPSVAAIAGDETQFNAWNGDLVLAYGPGDPEYEEVGKIVDQVFAERPEPPAAVGNATEFYSGEKEPGYWAKGAVQKVGQVGRHVFGALKNAVTRPKSFMLRQAKGGEPDPRVAALQTQLKQAGVYEGEVDGRYGPQTTAAVKAWQKQSGQRPTGVADTNTLRTLKLPASEAGFQRLFSINPETPANRAKLFPEGAPRPSNADAVEDLLAYDPIEQLRGGSGRDLTTAPSISRDRLGAGDEVDGGAGQDALGRGQVDDMGGGKATMPTPPPPRLRPEQAAPVSGGDGLTHKARRGDTFGKLAKQYLGDANRWPEIEAANPGVKARNIPIGAELVIPGTTTPPAPRPRPDTSTVLSDFNVSSTSGPSLETLRSLGLTESVWDNVVRSDPALNADAPPPAPTVPADDPNSPYNDWTREFDTPGPITWANEKMGVFEERAAPPPPAPEEQVGNLNYPGELPTRRAPPTQGAVSEPDPGLGPYGGTAPPPSAPGALTSDDIDARIAEMRRIDSARNVSRLPPSLNRSGGEAWGESYEGTPSLLTDIGLYDRAPEQGRAPAQISLDAMPERDAAATARADSASVRTFEQPAGAPRLDRPTGDRSSYATWGVPWDPLDVAAMPIPVEPEPARPPTVVNTGEGAPSADLWSQPGSGAEMTDDRPKAGSEPARTSAAPRSRGATITVNGTTYQYDDAQGSAEAINDMLGIPDAVSEPLSYVPAVEGSAMGQAVAPAIDRTPEFTRPDPVNMMALANEEARKSPGTVTPPKSQPARPSSPDGGAAAASGIQTQPSRGGIVSPTNPNFTGTSVETNPLTGQQYAVGKWSNGARAISGDGWTAVENPDGTFSYAGNPLKNVSLGLGGPAT